VMSEKPHTAHDLAQRKEVRWRKFGTMASLVLAVSDREDLDSLSPQR
jgi:hypothetical protein